LFNYFWNNIPIFLNTRQRLQEAGIPKIYCLLQVFSYNSWITKFLRHEPIDSATFATNSNNQKNIHPLLAAVQDECCFRYMPWNKPNGLSIFA
jgi:hypothetical protein